MPYVRFVLVEKHPDSGLNEGLFRLAYRLRKDPDVDKQDRAILEEVMAWFDKNLPVPSRFNRSSSKGYYRRATRGISWFRDTANECIVRMFSLKRVFEAHGHTVNLVREERVGYLVYEDEHQVVAEPFKDTATGG
jgi:hypothetical protein